MADVTTLDNLINNLAQEAKSFDENISVLFSITQNLIGENIALSPEATPTTANSGISGKLPQLAKYVSDLTTKNAQLVDITKKLSETL